MTTVFPGVEAGHAEQRIVPKPTFLPAPASETARGATVVIARLQRTAGVAEPRQRGLNLGSRQVGEPTRRDPLSDSAAGLLALASSQSLPVHFIGVRPEHYGYQPTDPVSAQVRMLGGASPVNQVRTPIGQMISQRPGRMVA